MTVDDVLNILIVDDNPDDRALVRREIAREFPNCQFQQVINARELSQAIGASRWDLVVTDYQLRWTDGLTIVLAVKGRWPECPVIMFTGSGNEEIAVQAMKAGLDDYVLKSPKHYVRLASAVHMALERAKQRKTLHEAERRYQNLFDDVPVGLFRFGPDGTIVDANPALMEMLGYPDRESLSAVKALNFFANAEERHRLLNALKLSGIIRLFETQFYRRDGKIIWAEVNARVIRDDQNKVICYEGSLEDITIRKEAEQSLRESEARDGAPTCTGFVRDITERRRAEKQLHDSREQLRGLAAYLQSVREEERTRIAREVHDELGQGLPGLKMDLAVLEKKVAEVSSTEDLQQFEEKLEEL